MKEHLYQISDVSEHQGRFASADVSGQVVVWTVGEALQVLMKGKFEDKLCQPLSIQWRNLQQFCSYNLNEISIWTLQQGSTTPSSFQTQVQETSRILDVAFSKSNPAMYAVTLNSVIILNSLNLQKIKEFKPSKKERVSHLFVVQNKSHIQNDSLVTISSKGLLSGEWHLSVIREFTQPMVTARIQMTTTATTQPTPQKRSIPACLTAQTLVSKWESA